MTFLIENRPYQHLNKVPRNRRTRKLPEGLLTLNRSRHVSKTVYYKIRPRRKQPPRIYGLPKLHKTLKTDCVIREQLRLWFVGVSRWQRISTNRKLSPLDQSEAKVKTVRRLSLSFFLRRFWTVSSVLLWVLIVLKVFLSFLIGCFLKKIQAWTGIEPMTSAIPVQRSNQLSYQANWELVNCEFVIYP